MPSELEEQKARKEGLIGLVISTHNKQVADDRKMRLRNRREIKALIREQRAAHAKWQEEQQRQADEGGWLAGMLQGAATGASVGTAFKPGMGTLIGGVIGGVAGGIHGGMEGRQAVQEISPYAGAITSLAGSYSAAQQNRAQNQALIDALGASGRLAGGQAQAPQRPYMDPRVPSVLDEGSLSLGAGTRPLEYQGGKRFELDYETGGKSDPLSADYEPEVSSMQVGNNPLMDAIIAKQIAAQHNPFNQPGVMDKYRNVTQSGFLDANIAQAGGYNFNLPEGYTGLPAEYLRRTP